MLQVLHWPRNSELLSDTIEAFYALNAMNALSATNDQRGRRTRAGALTNYELYVAVV